MPLPPNRKYNIGSGANCASDCFGVSESPTVDVAAIADDAEVAAGVALPTAAAAGVVPTGLCEEANAVEADDAPGDTPAIDLGTRTEASNGHKAGSSSMAGICAPPSVTAAAAANEAEVSVRKNAGPNKVPGCWLLDGSIDATWPENISLRTYKPPYARDADGDGHDEG